MVVCAQHGELVIISCRQFFYINNVIYVIFSYGYRNTHMACTLLICAFWFISTQIEDRFTHLLTSAFTRSLNSCVIVWLRK